MEVFPLPSLSHLSFMYNTLPQLWVIEVFLFSPLLFVAENLPYTKQN